MDIEVEFSGGACIFAALLCLILPLNWIGAAVAAAIFHEICHIGVVYFFGGKIRKLKIGITGAIMDADTMSSVQGLICILSGPIGSLALIGLHSRCPRLAVCALIHGIFNLLPIYPLDGGRALICITQILFKQSFSEQIYKYVRWISTSLILAGGIWGTYCAKLGWIPLLAALFLISRVKTVKIPCKEVDMGVQ